MSIRVSIKSCIFIDTTHAPFQLGSQQLTFDGWARLSKALCISIKLTVSSERLRSCPKDNFTHKQKHLCGKLPHIQNGAFCIYDLAFPSYWTDM